MPRKFNRDSYRSVAVPAVEAAPQQPPSLEEEEEKRRAALEAELRAATREYEDELQAKFDRLPRWITNDGGRVRYHYWNGEGWVEFDLNDPPLWAVENIDPDNLAPPGIRWG
jgi:hypothetical protein